MGVPWPLLPEGETTMALAVLNLASQARFSPGQVVMTAGVDELVRQGRLNPSPYLRRHLHGDWGDLDDSDRRQNDAALQSGEDRLFSSYQVTRDQIGRAHVCTPVTNAQLVCRPLLETQNKTHKPR